jgi:hypothetical protein
MKKSNTLNAKLASLLLMLAGAFAIATPAFAPAALAEVTVTSDIAEEDDSDSLPEVAEEEDVRDPSLETCDEVSEEVTRLSRC